MIPDKIYVREYPDGVARFWEEKKKDDVVATIPHEYIRKDALISFLEKEKYDLFNWHFQDEDRKFKVYEEVINKIKEL